MKIEGPDVIPTIIFPEAWEAAMTIDNEVAIFMAEYGIVRKEGVSKMVTVVAKMVQLSINKSFARIVEESEKEVGQ